jgi:tRNA pseudouridine32 synthase/23S rRNA pseudouridine746 synthase
LPFFVVLFTMSITNFVYRFPKKNTEADLPSHFTYPFYYQAHPLAVDASVLLQEKLTEYHPLTSNQAGRMYGVLVVKDAEGKLGYLTASSDNANDTLSQVKQSINFVPAIYRALLDSGFEKKQQALINDINAEITALDKNPDIAILKKLLQRTLCESDHEIQTFQTVMRANKKSRHHQRERLNASNLSTHLSANDQRTMSIQLARESVNDKKQLLTIKHKNKGIIEEITQNLRKLTDQIESLKKRRKKCSVKLQKHIFQQYQLLNIAGESKNLIEIFANTPTQKPPAGSGDCAAPKLLQFAFHHQLTPLCMAEFWWGKQPASAIRKHKHFYPACQSKCKPILAHMLSGMRLDKNPLLDNPAKNMPLEILFSDEHLVVVNKPAGLLSVPGKSIKDSVLTRIKAQFPEASGGLIVHRRDMATSGLLMLALNERAHKNLQLQFINKRVNKRYVACIDGIVKQQSGKICLPLRGDFDDRPKQMVCHEHGKFAETQWQLITNNGNRSKLFLYPITGRTHQLRMHCAHPLGLNMPIIGDSLYGTLANRLHLHAQRLCFSHPITGAEMNFEVNENF